MNSVNYEELNLVLEQLFEKRDDLQDQIDNNALLIMQMESSTSSLLYGEGDDFNLFSPRKKIGSGYKKDKLERDKAEYQQKNNLLIFERNKINSLIDIVQRVLDEEQKEESREAGEDTEDTAKDDDKSENETENETSEAADIFTEINIDPKNLKQNLSRLVKKIEQCKKFVDQDPRRAKLELDGVNKKMNKMIDDLN